MAALNCFSASLSKNKNSATKIYLNLGEDSSDLRISARKMNQHETCDSKGLRFKYDMHIEMIGIYSIANLLEAIQKCAQEHNLRVQGHDRTVHVRRQFAQSYRVKCGGGDGSRGP